MSYQRFLIPTFVCLMLCSTTAQGRAAEIVYGKQGDQELRGYLAVPEQAGERPAIVLIHEWWGLNDDIRRKADEFAKQGYVALAVDMYGGKSTTEAAEAVIAFTKSSRANTLDTTPNPKFPISTSSTAHVRSA